MNWEEIHNEYTERIQREKDLGIDNVRKIYDDVLNTLTTSDIEAIGRKWYITYKIRKDYYIDPVTGFFVSKEYPDIIIGISMI